MIVSVVASAAAKPNVVLILVDDLGYGELGVYGGRQIPTPHIDALARSGVLLTDGYASAAQCAPTRAGLMTGRYQESFGFYYNPPAATNPAYPRFGLPADEVTLGQALQRQGYVTGLVGKWHLGFKPEQFPLQRGFDSFFGILDGGHVYLGSQPGVPIYRGTAKVTEKSYLTRAFARESVAFIHAHAHEPFFLYAAFTAVHAPLQAEPAMLQRFAAIPDLRRRTFAAMLASLDDAVGEIVRALAQEGLTRDTLVLFLSDNGGPTFTTTSSNGPLRSGKGSSYDGGIRVPFFLAWPGHLGAGQLYRRPVISLDLFPTIMAAATGRTYADPRLDGVNLLPFLAAPAAARAPHRDLFWNGAVRQGDWKLVLRQPRPELYDLRRDIGEAHDLAASRRTLAAELRRTYAAWEARLPPPSWPAR